jgi:hypothetical protein
VHSSIHSWLASHSLSASFSASPILFVHPPLSTYPCARRCISCGLPRASKVIHSFLSLSLQPLFACFIQACTALLTLGRLDTMRRFYKILLLGDQAVGKTALATRYVEDSFVVEVRTPYLCATEAMLIFCCSILLQSETSSKRKS